MILRQLAEGIQEQNWSTVVLEVLIVVVGIFLGLQVDDWNEGRKDRIEERDYLERLEADFVAHREALTFSIGLSDVRLQQIEMVEAAVRSPAVAAQNPDRFITAVEKAAWASYLPLEPNAYAELLSTGRMTLLGSRELRDLLVAFYGGVVRWEPILNVTDERGAFRRAVAGLLNKEYLVLIEEGAEEAEWPTNNIGATPGEARAIAEDLAGRAEAVKWLPKMYHYHVLARKVMRGHLQRAEAVIAEIENNLGHAAKSAGTNR